MRKVLLFAPMLLFLLTACGGEEPDPVAQLQRQYAAVTSATMEAEITCHYEDEVREYTLLCAYAPENLAGISAAVENGTLTLSYDDLSLDAGVYSAAAVSPVAALPKLMEAAGRGYPAEQSEEVLDERDCIRMGCDLSDDTGTLYTTWFDKETLLPLRSEIATDGVLVFEVAWSRFEVTGQAETESDDAQEQENDTQQETGTVVS